MATIGDEIKNLKEHISDYDLDELTEKEWTFVRYYGEVSTELAQVKSRRAERMLDIQKIKLEAGEKPSQKDIDNTFYATEGGKFIVREEIMLKAISRLISAIRSRREEISKLK